MINAPFFSVANWQLAINKSFLNIVSLTIIETTAFREPLPIVHCLLPIVYCVNFL